MRVTLDMETRSIMELGPGSKGDVICGAYKIGDGPVHVFPTTRGIPRDSRGAVDWGVVSWQREQAFVHFKEAGEARVRQQVEYYQHLAFMEKSWIERKFLTIAARARTLFSR